MLLRVFVTVVDKKQFQYVTRIYQLEIFWFHMTLSYVIQLLTPQNKLIIMRVFWLNITTWLPNCRYTNQSYLIIY